MIQFRAPARIRPSKIALLLALGQWLLVLIFVGNRIPAVADRANDYTMMYIFAGPVVAVWEFCAGIAACLQVRKFPLLSILLWIPILVPATYPPLVMTLSISRLVFRLLAGITLGGMLAVYFIKDPENPES